MRPVLLVTVFAGLLVSGCYVVDYRYDYYNDPYDEAYDQYYHPGYPAVRYYSPIEPLVDLAILGVVLHGWHHWGTEHYHASPHQSHRMQR